MDLYNFISLGLDKTLRCFVCKNYLSYFPISLCSNNQSLCGRCAVPEGLISFQEEALETVCQFLTFPCRYQSEGCPEELAPLDMPEHEKNCSFRTVQCIISKPAQCNWKGSLPSLLPHCRTEHSDLILKNGEFQMDLSVLEECTTLLEHNDVLFIFTRKFDLTSGILSCALYNHEYAVTTTSCLAQLNVKNGNRTVLLDLEATGFTQMIFTEISLSSVRSADKQDSLLCQINIGNIQNEEHRLERVNATLLPVLKCSSCSEFALPPIYLCVENMETVCSDCSQKHQDSCKVCSKNTTSSNSNIILDKIAILAEYPCKYQKNGCMRTLEYRQMEDHQDVCTYVNDKCPFSALNGCRWKGLKKDVNDHCLKTHQELLTSSSDELELSDNDDTMNYKLIQFSNCLFRLEYRTDGVKYNWAVETIGSCEEKFMFEIDLVDGNDSGRRMLRREFCGQLTDTFWQITNEKDQISNFFIFKDEVAVLKFHVLNV